MIRGEVEQTVNALADLVGERPVLEIAFPDVNLVFDRCEILSLAAGKVVGDPDVSARCDQFFDEV
jgi:hypothetical protein